MRDQIRRREFIALGGAAAVPILMPHVARAQRAVPVIGYLDARSPEGMAERMLAFRQGLKEAGFVEGENVSIVYRWAENQMDRLPALAADLVRRQVTVIATTAGPSTASVAKAATTTIPVVFLVAEDPVRLGLVSSLARPGGNLTGINLFNAELAAKRLELLHELVPQAARIAVLVNPADTANTEAALKDVGPAARALGLQVQVFNADTSPEIDAVFVAATPFLNIRRVQLVQLTAFHRLPAAYPLREFADAGGLMSYGSDIADARRQVGRYVGRILKGAKPADLPVVQASKFELVINHQTARMLGLTVPPLLLTIADEVIE